MRFASLSAVLTLGAAAAAHPVSAANVVADPAQVAEVFKAAGYRAEPKTSEDGDVYLSSSTGGYTFLVFFNGCDQGTTNCKSVQFYAGFTPEPKFTPEQINAYARGHSWGRFYLDEEGDPAVEMDVDLEQGGMSEALFKDNIAYWEAVLSDFGKFVFADPAKGVDKPAT